VAFYDDRDVFETYMSAVAPGPSSPNHVMEEPALLAALGDVRGLRILDLGCGDAAIGRRLLALGCRSYKASTRRPACSRRHPPRWTAPAARHARV
jgi:hypothetical protein